MSASGLLGPLARRPIQVLAVVMLLIALPPLPYGYYQLLRLVVFISSGFLAWKLFQGKQIVWAVVMVILMLLFNPISPLFLKRDIWAVIDLITAVLFGVCPQASQDRRND